MQINRTRSWAHAWVDFRARHERRVLSQIRGIDDTGLDILDDDIDAVLNALGDDDVNLDDFKDKLASLDYMQI